MSMLTTSDGTRIFAFSQTDLTEDLTRIDVPALLVHGDKERSA